MNGNRRQYTSTPLYNMKKNGWKGAQKQVPEEQKPGEGGRRQNKRYQWLALLLAAVLPLLFILALLIPSNALRWAFLIAAALAVAAMWALRAFVLSARNTLTVVYTALAVVIGLALFIDGQSQHSIDPTVGQKSYILTEQAGGSLNSLLTGTDAPNGASPEVTPEVVSAAYQRLVSFLQAWQSKRVVDMKPFCSPEWVSNQASPETALYQLLQNTYPVEFEIERIEGSDGDTARIALVKVRMSGLNGESLQRLRVIIYAFFL